MTGQIAGGARTLYTRLRRAARQFFWGVGVLGFMLAGSAHAEPRTIFVLGDSLTAGYGLDQADAFPAQLQRALAADGHAVRVINGGVSGDTTSGALARLRWSLPEQVDGVIVELGGNDMLRGVPPPATRRALDAILQELAARRVPVLLAGMLAAPNLGRRYEQAFNGIFPALARKHDALFYPFFMDGVHDQPQLLLDDATHPNAAGVAAIVAGILPQVKLLLARIEKNP